MDADAYQKTTLRTGSFVNERERLVFAALEASAEVGEVANLVYKHAFQGHPLDPRKLGEEIGDAVWGLALICETAGLSLSAVMQQNIDKLRARYPTGFTVEESLARRDHANEG